MAISRIHFLNTKNKTRIEQRGLEKADFGIAKYMDSYKLYFNCFTDFLLEKHKRQINDIIKLLLADLKKNKK